MASIKVKFSKIFDITPYGIDINKMNPKLEALANFKAKGAALLYDLSIKLKKAIDAAIAEFNELRLKIGNELAVEKKITMGDGTKTKTNLQIIDMPKDKTFTSASIVKEIDGKEVKDKIIGRSFDLGDNLEEFTKRVNETLNIEIELACEKIRLSKLSKEDCSTLDFTGLEDFIVNDLEDK